VRRARTACRASTRHPRACTRPPGMPSRSASRHDSSRPPPPSGSVPPCLEAAARRLTDSSVWCVSCAQNKVILFMDGGFAYALKAVPPSRRNSTYLPIRPRPWASW
jgi:hypothetical protein